MIRPSRVGLVVATTAVAVLFAVGPAVAQDKPPVGSSECTAAVEKDPDVVAATQGSAGGLPAAKKQAESTLCSQPTTTSPTTTETTSSEPAPSAEPAEPDTRADVPANRRVAPGNDAPPPKRAGRPAGDRDCADFATQQQAQQYFESIGGSSTNNADRLDANGNGVACENLADDSDNQDAEATTTGDDGSTAKTSGDQVTEVPQGSAQTGGA